jgi:hypothetical protein
MPGQIPDGKSFRKKTDFTFFPGSKSYADRPYLSPPRRPAASAAR